MPKDGESEAWILQYGWPQVSAISSSEAAGSVSRATSKAIDGWPSARTRTSRVCRITAKHADTRAKLGSAKRNHMLTVLN